MAIMLLALISCGLAFAQELPKAAAPQSALPQLTAEQIMEKAVAATGDAASREKIKTTYMKSDVEIGSQGVRGTLEVYWKAPNKRLTVTKIENGGETRQGYDGKNAWLKDQTGAVRDITGLQLAVIQRTAQMNSDAQWKTLYDKLELQATGKVGGKDAYILKITPKSGSPILRYYDADTFLLIRSDMNASGPQGDFVAKTAFTDYREVDGVKVAFQTTQQFQAGTVVSRIIEIKNNVAMDDSIFAKPPDASAAGILAAPAPK